MTSLLAQEVFTLEESIAFAMDKNYDLRIARNNTVLAKTETELLNSGFLPRVSATGGVSYSDENQSVVFADGNATSIDGAITESYNASITAEYTLFDGLERKFTNDRRAENLMLSELQERQQIENTIIDIYESYFNVAFQRQVVENLKINIQNSTDRLTRAQKALKYGQGTTLDELNAQVDLNNDSINYTNAVRDLNNLKRNFNLVVGREVTSGFVADTTVNFSPPIQEETILESAKTNNIQLILANQNILLSELDIKINKAKFLPKINGSGSYRWNESQNPPTSFALANESSGINLGLTMSWNLFDGGANTIRIKTAKITRQNREIELERISEQVRTEVLNAYETYSIAHYTLAAESKNVSTNELNFQRTQKQYSLGQITTVEFRQAQINLFNALNNYARAKYDLKIAELNLKQLGGLLLL
ncbi:TolC family protein [Flagellimonas maritima]|nr:TolC family protein [Allomuricauda aurantiaca]